MNLYHCFTSVIAHLGNKHELCIFKNEVLKDINCLLEILKVNVPISSDYKTKIHFNKLKVNYDFVNCHLKAFFH